MFRRLVSLGRESYAWKRRLDLGVFGVVLLGILSTVYGAEPQIQGSIASSLGKPDYVNVLHFSNRFGTYSDPILTFARFGGGKVCRPILHFRMEMRESEDLSATFMTVVNPDTFGCSYRPVIFSANYDCGYAFQGLCRHGRIVINFEMPSGHDLSTLESDQGFIKIVESYGYYSLSLKGRLRLGETISFVPWLTLSSSGFRLRSRTRRQVSPGPASRSLF